VTPLHQVRGGNARLTTLSPSQIAAHRTQAESLGQLRQSRTRIEAAGKPAGGSIPLPLRTRDTHIAPAADSAAMQRPRLPASVSTLPQVTTHGALPQIINQAPQTYRAPAPYQYQSHYGPSVQRAPAITTTPRLPAYTAHAPAHVNTPHWSMPSYQRAPAPVFHGGGGYHAGGGYHGGGHSSGHKR